MMKSLTKTLIAILLICGVFATGSRAQSDNAVVDHSLWNDIVKTTVNEVGWVDYQAIRRDWQRHLNAYVSALGNVDAARLKSHRERMAFWINAYNAVTVKTLLDEGLPETVPHAAFFGKNIFKQENYRISGKIRSLDEIEHGILRKRYSDPRIHAALVCGASSCPRLRPEAYTGEKLDRQLTEEAQRWVQSGRNKNGRRKNRLDKARNIYFVSKIFDWFNEDFHGGGQDGVLKFLKQFGDETDRAHLEKNKVKIKYQDYDWSLNNQDS